MSNIEYAKQQARIAAMFDYAHNYVADPGRHGARPKSAWSDWYHSKYQELETENQEAFADSTK